MSLTERQARLIEDYTLIENPLERFSAIVERYRKLPALPPEEQVAENLVPGCVSRVWVAGNCENGVCHFRSEADSPILQGVVRLLTDFYSGSPPDEVLACEPDFLDALRLTDQLTPTRRNGLRQVRQRILDLTPATSEPCKSTKSGTL